jgi:methionine transaminase
MERTIPRPVIADKLPHIGTTIFTTMGQLAAETGAVNLSQGFPDFPVDPRLVELVNKAMRGGHNQYAPMAGLPALREAVTEKVERIYGIDHDPDTQVTITAGGTQAIFTAIAAVVRPGDEVIVIDPAYDCYAPAVELFGGLPVHVQLDATMRFDAEAVAAALSQRTRMLIINTPHNPGGRILRPADLESIARMLQDTDVILLSDEVYEHIIFDGEKHASVIAHPMLRDRAFVVFSFGKTFHATGWKTGYVIAPAELMKLFRKVHQYNVFSVNTPVQHALAEYLRDPDNYQYLPEFYQRKRDRFLQGLLASRFKPLPCEGSYFMVADHSAIGDMGDMELCVDMARHHKVAAIPLSPFYRTPPPELRLVRFCFAKEDRTLDLALERLCKI